MPDSSPPLRPAGKSRLPGGPLGPLSDRVFRMLWGTTLVANVCMWMNDVAAAWMMTSLAAAPIWVALVQTASALPVFLLGLPSGAMADTLDRRRYFIATQFWVAGVALVLAVAVLSDAVNPPLLLLLTFANGIGLAMRWPVYAAIVPELIRRTELPAALALNGVAMNAARIGGPLLAGAIIAGAGTAYVFVVNAVLSLVSAMVVMRWRRQPATSPLGREPLLSAMRVGIQFVRQSANVRAVLARTAVFFFHSTALLALLPLVARNLQGGAAMFTILMACMGGGAIVAVMFLSRLRQRMQGDALVLRGALLHAAMTMTIAFSASPYVAMAAMVFSGMAWIATANSLSVAAQLALPDWVRARGMSIYQTALMGASAAGAATWGHVATAGDVQRGLAFAAASGVVAIVAVLHLVRDEGTIYDLTPSPPFVPPVAPSASGAGHIVMQIEYRIDPGRAEAFMRLMQESRRSRLRQGALGWELLQDIGDPGRYVEQIVDESWTEHLRRLARATSADAALREQRIAFHIGSTAPLVTRHVAAIYRGN